MSVVVDPPHPPPDLRPREHPLDQPFLPGTEIDLVIFMHNQGLPAGLADRHSKKRTFQIAQTAVDLNTS